jgi:hypothetical protein
MILTNIKIITNTDLDLLQKEVNVWARTNEDVLVNKVVIHHHTDRHEAQITYTKQIETETEKYNRLAKSIESIKREMELIQAMGEYYC